MGCCDVNWTDREDEQLARTRIATFIRFSYAVRPQGVAADPL